VRVHHRVSGLGVKVHVAVAFTRELVEQRLGFTMVTLQRHGR
jgi:hypothetical protein